ncbi:peptide chain release factor N(5)-glutamine methyltransferase [Gracilimonas mengyeensis]|uniref:Release factor glutamine methyltransferase n=1 Tax=Gracilimonas mengyeensis TaxID=1302730 RepID=A0A521E5C2_9BACT|nr:peptide chain release factor N(5)-glutamine methyltransferase [Gracilimonas mengyeensis]SMO79062.1 [protein release factor]-glutamine N5-methyltransferase [Gracilimonas mengyeensis]
MPQTPSIWTVLSMLEWATEYFEERQVKSPRFSIEWLLADVLDIKRLDLYLSYDRPLSSDELDLLRPMVKRRAAHEPLQYITGETDFHHIKVKVKPGVLIPRQETEQLVELILNEYNQEEPKKVLDVGTGSGCIPVALKKARESWEVYASDISEEALQQAKINAEYNEAEVHFAKDDLFVPKAFSDNRFNIIVSNPPYILNDEKEGLDKEVKEYEPESALFCESTEKMYGALEKLCSEKLQPEGVVYLELHEDHAKEVLDLFLTRNWKAELKEDYSDKLRFLIAKKA